MIRLWPLPVQQPWFEDFDPCYDSGRKCADMYFFRARFCYNFSKTFNKLFVAIIAAPIQTSLKPLPQFTPGVFRIYTKGNTPSGLYLSTTKHHGFIAI